MTARLSPEEAATVARFDAAEAAPESLRERVAEAIWDCNDARRLGITWGDLKGWFRDKLRDSADAAIDVIRGDS